MLTQSQIDKRQLIIDSLESTPKFSPLMAAALEQSRRFKPTAPINEDGFSPFVFSAIQRPSNRIQLKIFPHFENKRKTSNLQESKDAARFRKERAAIERRALGEGTASPEGAAGNDPLASLPNFTAPFSPELEFQEWAELEQDIQNRLTKLHSTSIPDLPKPKSFTPHARLMLLDSAGALELEGYTPSDFYFFTGTLPGSSSAACEGFSRYASKILDSFKKVVRRLELPYDFNTWEWQMRSKYNLVPALHLHYVVVCPDTELGSQLPQILEDAWFRLLIKYSEKSGVDFFEKHEKLGGGRWNRSQLKVLSERVDNPLFTCKTIQCTRSPAAYLSKYVGKGCLSSDKDFQKKFETHNIPLYYPPSWWSISNALRALINKHIHSYSFLADMNQCMEAYHGLVSILEDEDFDLVQLALPVFIPEWSTGLRIYRNFYCKSDTYEDCSEFLSTYSDTYTWPDGTPGNYQSSRLVYVPRTVESIRITFESDSSGNLMSRLISSLPFYCVLQGLINWDNPIVAELAFSILNEEIDYPTPESLEDRIRWQQYVSSNIDQQSSQYNYKVGYLL